MAAVRSRRYIAVPPGETIKEALEVRAISLEEFRNRTGFSERMTKDLFNGDAVLTADIAKRLEQVLGIRAGFWMNLESIYRRDLANVIAENEKNAERKSRGIGSFLRACYRHLCR